MGNEDHLAGGGGNYNGKLYRRDDTGLDKEKRKEKGRERERASNFYNNEIRNLPTK